MMLAVLLPSGRWLMACRRRWRGHPALDRGGLFLRRVGDEEGARDADLGRVEAEAVGQHRRFVGVEAVDRLVDRGELVEQQIMAPRGDIADALGMAGALPERRVRLLVGRRLDDDVVELPVLAVEREAFVARSRTW